MTTEPGHDIDVVSPLTYRRSTRCESNQCVEIATRDRHVFIRDSAASYVVVGRQAFERFVDAVKRDDLTP